MNAALQGGTLSNPERKELWMTTETYLPADIGAIGGYMSTRALAAAIEAAVHARNVMFSTECHASHRIDDIEGLREWAAACAEAQANEIERLALALFARGEPEDGDDRSMRAVALAMAQPHMRPMFEVAILPRDDDDVLTDEELRRAFECRREVDGDDEDIGL